MLYPVCTIIETDRRKDNVKFKVALTILFENMRTLLQLQYVQN